MLLIIYHYFLHNLTPTLAMPLQDNIYLLVPAPSHQTCAAAASFLAACSTGMEQQEMASLCWPIFVSPPMELPNYQGIRTLSSAVMIHIHIRRITDCENPAPRP